MAAEKTNDPWLRRNLQSAFTIVVHLVHSAVIFGLTWLVHPASTGSMLRYGWGVGAFFSVLTLLVFLRVGSYEGTSEEEVGALVRRGYWMATGTYLCLAAIALFLIIRRGFAL